MSAASVSESVDVAATPQVVWALLTDLPVFASLGEEVTAMRWRTGSSAVPGAVFSGSNRNGLRRWTTRCTVTAAEPGRSFGFDVDLALPGTAIARWQYDIEPTATGCRVTESWTDRRHPAFARLSGLATGVTDRERANTDHIRITLDRLRQRAEAGS
jgi:hypothetical protein